MPQKKEVQECRKSTYDKAQRTNDSCIGIYLITQIKAFSVNRTEVLRLLIGCQGYMYNKIEW